MKNFYQVLLHSHECTLPNNRIPNYINIQMNPSSEIIPAFFSLSHNRWTFFIIVNKKITYVTLDIEMKLNCFDLDIQMNCL